MRSWHHASPILDSRTLPPTTLHRPMSTWHLLSNRRADRQLQSAGTALGPLPVSRELPPSVHRSREKRPQRPAFRQPTSTAAPLSSCLAVLTPVRTFRCVIP